MPLFFYDDLFDSFQEGLQIEMNSLIPGNIRAQVVREKFHSNWRLYQQNNLPLFEATCA